MDAFVYSLACALASTSGILANESMKSEELSKGQLFMLSIIYRFIGFGSIGMILLGFYLHGLIFGILIIIGVWIFGAYSLHLGRTFNKKRIASILYTALTLFSVIVHALIYKH